MNPRIVVIMPFALAVSACAHVSTSVTPLDPSVRLARTCPAGVKLYVAPDRVLQPYREVALLNSTGEVKYSDEGEMFGSMREMAGFVGANGVILGGIDEPNAITKVAADVAKSETVRKGKAMAIYVPDGFGKLSRSLRQLQGSVVAASLLRHLAAGPVQFTLPLALARCGSHFRPFRGK